jgi:hypothetical protein
MRRAVVVAIACLTGTAGAEPIALDQLLARADAVTREVARARGLSLKRPIPNDVVDKVELRRRLVEMMHEEKTARQLAGEGFAMRRWGLLPLALDYEALMLDLLTEQIAGYYDTDRKRLTISKSAGDDADWAELVLAHEIQHGLQDQNFDLKKLEDLPDSEGDAAMARHALVEGDGIAVMLEVTFARKGFAIPWSNPVIAAELAKAMAAGDLERAPLAVRELTMFPYRAGFGFVAALRRRQPWSAVDAAFRKPPRSTEQVIHPEKYAADERPLAVTVELPPVLAQAGYAAVHETVWGELGLALFLRSHGVVEGVAATAAAGWGGDRVLVIAPAGERNPQRAIGLARIELDSEADAIEAHEAIVKALDAGVVGASIQHEAARTRWFAIDGTVSWAERRGAVISIGHGAPAWAAAEVERAPWDRKKK